MRTTCNVLELELGSFCGTSSDLDKKKKKCLPAGLEVVFLEAPAAITSTSWTVRRAWCVLYTNYYVGVRCVRAKWYCLRTGNIYGPVEA